MMFQLKIIDNYYQSLDNTEASDIFREINQIKSIGYNTKETGYYFPLAVDDFYCTHFAVCDPQANEVAMCFKIIRKDSSQFYKNTPFPMDQLIEQYCNEVQQQKVKNIIASFPKGNISYSGGWAINKKYKNSKVKEQLKSIYCGIHYLYHLENDLVACTACGIPQSGTLKFFQERWNFKLMLDDDITLKGLDGFTVKLIYQTLKDMAESKKNDAKDCLPLWQNRIELFHTPKNKIKSA